MIRSLPSPSIRTFILLISVVLLQLVIFRVFFLKKCQCLRELPPKVERLIENIPDWQKTLNFTGFNNDTGTSDGHYIIPNYVHFIKFRFDSFSFIHFVCVLAAFKHQRPEKLFIHTDVEQFQGRYWKLLLDTPGFREVGTRSCQGGDGFQRDGYENVSELGTGFREVGTRMYQGVERASER